MTEIKTAIMETMIHQCGARVDDATQHPIHAVLPLVGSTISGEVSSALEPAT